MGEIMDLAERCEAAEKPRRELDAAIAAAVRDGLPKGCAWALRFPNWEGVFNGEVRIIGNVNGNGQYIAGTFVSPKFTASIDAAMQLDCPELEQFGGAMGLLREALDRMYRAGVGKDALARFLTAAFLRARAS